MKLWLPGSICALLPAVLAAGPAANAEGRPPQAAAKLEAERAPDAQPPLCGPRHTPDPGEVPQLERLPMTPCVGGMAGIYPCNNVDLMAFMPMSTIGGGGGSSLWGWTDPDTQREYALMGRTSGTAFVDITDAASPVYLGNLPTHTVNSTWREMKTHGYYAYIVSEASGHGMQVFDLRRLRNVPTPPVTFTEDGWYGGFTTCHNIVINTQTGFAYGVGSNSCSGGLHMMSLANPVAPVFVGCFSGDGYTHDAQCVIYNGPDTAHVGKEICFNSNTDSLTIVDVTNKSTPVMLSRTTYAGSGYTHQGWITADHAHFLIDDELDEQNFGHPTWTYIWNLADLDAPILIGHYTGPTNAIDHNLFIHQGHAFEANYTAGLRILDIAGIAAGNLTEVAYFDIYPPNNNAVFNGAWNNYPFFNSGNVIVSGMGTGGGLFVVRPNPPVPVELLSFEVQ
jgi:choice-of-anchor B domain-containing protein